MSTMTVASKSDIGKKLFFSCKAYYKNSVFAVSDLLDSDLSVNKFHPLTITHIKTGLRIGRYKNMSEAKNCINELMTCGIDWTKTSKKYTKQEGKTVFDIVRKNNGSTS